MVLALLPKDNAPCQAT